MICLLVTGAELVVPKILGQSILSGILSIGRQAQIMAMLGSMMVQMVLTSVPEV